MENSSNEEIPPTSPATPGGPLVSTGFRTDHRTATTAAGNNNNNNNNKSFLLLKNSTKCFSTSVQEWTLEDGALPTSLSCSFPPPPVPMARKVGAEFIGTFIVMFAGTAAAIVNQKTQGAETLIGCAASTGLSVMIVILSTGHISGAHINPAITISFAALKHFPWKHVPVYIIAQVMASVCAAFALKGVFHPFMSGGVTVPSAEGGGGYGQAFALEFIISFILMFVVTAVTTDTRAVGELAGIAVGATVMLNILIAGPVSGGSMNPVRTLGPAIAANNYKAIWVYLLAPILGALCGAGAYTAVKLPQEHNDDHSKAKASTPGSFTR